MKTQLSQAQESIYRFLDEAKQCAELKLGFAAMLTTFPVVLSVAESMLYTEISQGRKADLNDKVLFQEYVPQMSDKSWWILRKSSAIITDHDIAIGLYHLRNSLVHQHSLPIHFGLVNTQSEVKPFFKRRLGVKTIISVLEFVEAVRKTTDQLINLYPNAIFDPNTQGLPRSPAVRVGYMPGSNNSITSGSAIRLPPGEE